MNRRTWMKAIAALPAAASAQDPITGPSRDADSFLGDWQGKWTSEARPAGGPLVAQVIPRAAGAYDINLQELFDERCRPTLAKGSVNGGRLRFSAPGWSGSASADSMRGEGKLGARAIRFELKRTTRLSPTLGAPPPKGAVVLFDGSNLDQWEGIDQKHQTGPSPWQVENGVAVAPPIPRGTPAFRHIGTKQLFRNYKLHLEFRLPLFPEASGQARANSGIVFEDYSYHELQILDSYGEPGYWDDCGAIYRVAAPIVNMCAPPLQWQTYDVEYRSTSARIITVHQNGKAIHKDFALPETAAGEKLRREEPKARRPGRIRLTYHDSPIAFRNIWLVPV